MKYAPEGSIIHGTYRNADLLKAFSDALELLSERIDTEPKHALLIKESRECDPDSYDANEIIVELSDTLNSYAAPGMYFGSHEGDGSDFGFWECPTFEEWD